MAFPESPAAELGMGEDPGIIIQFFESANPEFRTLCTAEIFRLGV